MTTSSFIPKDYEVSDGASLFFKLKQGDNKFRVLSDALVGKLGWKDNKPFRRAGADAEISPEEVDVSDQGKPKIHDFMAFYIYDYATEKVCVAEFTQKGIKKEFVNYANDEEWGHPKEYDITISKSGEKLLTKYTFKPSPAKPFSKAVQAAFEEAEPTFDLAGALNIES